MSVSSGVSLTWLTNAFFALYRLFVTVQINLASSRISFAWPYIVFTGFNYDYKDALCTVHISQVDASFTLLPHPLCFIGSRPFGLIKLHEFKVHVYGSEATPSWLGQLRSRCIFAILNGTTTRLDDIKTGITFKDTDGNTRAEVNSAAWYIENAFDRRQYIFGRIAAVLRRNWDTDFGVFAMVANDCQWYMNDSYLRDDSAWDMVKRCASFLTHAIPRFFHNPLVFTDLYIKQLDVTFGHFRIHDAELVKQCGAAVRNNYTEANGRGSLDGFTWDMFMDTVFRVCTDN
ncbi:hypothetical protein CYLTODRAFT_485539 [Cylindrobasidium torrendii FP15055 ss-10]|uniref:Uncharacterized protein n=1 Tax=Cylindrobasidium torrendii FP15055 ss-10 TaxID=1314674 RepID=A0A0D7BS70_9AGAR|nr:hypothetical protein CYLTODRAFT_485539 [Cylindrobasidium torrendii FP15055 ss-10]